MTLANAKVLHKHFIEIGRTGAATDLERRYPELKAKKAEPLKKPKAEPDKEVKDDGTKPKG